jgi:hypothetical protein
MCNVIAGIHVNVMCVHKKFSLSEVYVSALDICTCGSRIVSGVKEY